MNQLEYIPGIGGASIQLDGPVAFVGTAENLRGREWNFDLGYRDLVNANRPARVVDVTLWTDADTANAFRRVADADVMAKTPGTLIAQGEWKQACYILEAKPRVIHYGDLEIELKVALLEGAWWRLENRSFQSSSGQSSTYLDYPYDYSYDFSSASATNNVEASVFTPSDVHIVFYGGAINPYVIVGGNKYQVNVTVPAGGYLTVDGRDKTIMLTLANGTVQDVFADGVRGSGEGGGQYIFEPLKRGTQSVTWDGSFAFDFGWYEQEGEPPWSLY